MLHKLLFCLSKGVLPMEYVCHGKSFMMVRFHGFNGNCLMVAVNPAIFI